MGIGAGSTLLATLHGLWDLIPLPGPLTCKPLRLWKHLILTIGPPGKPLGWAVRTIRDSVQHLQIQGRCGMASPERNEESALAWRLFPNRVCVCARACVCVTGTRSWSPHHLLLLCQGRKLRTHGDVGMGGQKDDVGQAMKGKLGWTVFIPARGAPRAKEQAHKPAAPT